MVCFLGQILVDPLIRLNVNWLIRLNRLTDKHFNGFWLQQKQIWLHESFDDVAILHHQKIQQ